MYNLLRNNAKKNNTLTAIKPNQTTKLNDFEQKLKRLFYLKKINISDINTDLINNKFLISMDLFFQTQKLIKYKTKIKRGYTKSFKNQNKFFVNVRDIYKQVNISAITIRNLNAEIDNFLIKYFYSVVKKFAGILFARRFNLYVDFIKITALFIQGKINPSMFLNYLGQVFARLPKKKHSRFFFFLKLLFQEILNAKNSEIQGIKLVSSGKLQGKTRASVLKITVGNVPIQTVDKNIIKSKIHVYTLYGAFGFTLWTNY